jgi:uncharacterized protein YggT (Ycf19 family)
MEVHKKVVTEAGNSQEVVETHQQVASTSDIKAVKANKKNQVVWYIVGVIETLLALRLLFQLLGARRTGFVDMLYSLTDIFVAPFRGIFPTPRFEGSYFDTPTMLALIIIPLIGWGISSLVDLNNPKK